MSNTKPDFSPLTVELTFPPALGAHLRQSAALAGMDTADYLVTVALAANAELLTSGDWLANFDGPTDDDE